MLKTLETPRWSVADESDGDLLDRFIAERDETAFAEIVRRHGLMVLGVCQRVLDNRHDAEDCFQAAFMVLVRKAATIQPRDMVGNWLYGVAYRTALEARKVSARRRQLEKKKQAMPQPESDADLWQELRPVLDQELSRLPDKFRLVVVACDLEGKTRSEVADQLGVPEGTVASRLARGRGMLAKRLRRHRLIVTPGFLATLLSEQARPLILPETLVARTAQLAAGQAKSPPIGRLADAVVAGMLWTKLKIATALVCSVGLLGLGIASMLPSADAGKAPLPPKAEPNKKKPHRLPESILRKVDFAKQEVQTAALEGQEVHDLAIKPTTEVIIGGQAGNFGQLHEGMIVHVVVQRAPNGEHVATRIEAVALSVSGAIEAVEEGAVTLRADGIANKFEIDAAAPVRIDGEAKKAHDLRSKMSAKLRLAVDRPIILAVEAHGVAEGVGDRKRVDP